MVIICSGWGLRACHSLANLLFSFLTSMVRAHGLKNRNLESKGKRPLGASSSSSLLGLKGPLEEVLGVSPDLSAKGDLAGITPLTAEVIAQRWASGPKVHEGAAQGRSSVSESEEVAAIKGGFNLASNTSKVT